MIKTVIITLLSSIGLLAQTASYPSAIVTDRQLMVAANNISTTLGLAITSTTQTSVTVAATAGMLTNMLLTFSDTGEIVVVCQVTSSTTITLGFNGVCPSTAARGFDGTTATTHISGTKVSAFYDAWHRNSDRVELEAVETSLGVNLANVVTAAGSKLNGAVIPASQTCLGSNSSSQLVAGTCSSASISLLFYTSSYGGSIPNAITAASGAGGGTVVVNQSYSSSTGLVLPPNVNFQCLPSTTITQTSNSTDVLFLTSPSAINNVISGCTFIGGAYSIAGFGPSSNLTIKGNTFTGFHTGPVIITAGMANLTFSNNIVTAAGSGCSEGVFFQDPGDNLTATENAIDTTGCGAAHGLAVHTFAGGGTATKLNISDNSFIQGGTNFAIEIQQNNGQGMPTGVVIHGNKIKMTAAGFGGISLGGNKSTSITDNQIDMNGNSPSIAAIEVADSEDVQVSGNHAFGGGVNAGGLSVDSSTKVTVSGNTIDGLIYQVNSGTFSGVLQNSYNSITHNVINIPASSTSTHGILVQCNVMGCVGTNNRINYNIINGVSVSSSFAVYVEQDSGTITGMQVIGNQTAGFTNPLGFTGGLIIDTSSAIPGGSTGQVQFNSSGAFAGTSGTSPQVLMGGATPSFVTVPIYAAGGGTANAQTVTYTPAVASLTNGLWACWLPAAANTLTNPTLAINGLASKTIIKNQGSALTANDLLTTAIACAIYDGTNMELQNPQTNSGGGGGSVTFQVGGVTAATSATFNMVAGAGITLNGSNVGGVATVQVSPDTAVVLSQSTMQAGTPLLNVSASASGTAFTACPTPVVGAYATGMVVNWVPDVNGTPGAITFNLCALGAKSVKESDGTTNPASGDIVASKLVPIWYDGTLFRLVLK